MKIEEINVGDSLVDDWGNTLKVVEVLKTRIKVSILKLNTDGKYDYGYDRDVRNDSLITYDKAHLQFLNKKRKS